jgi:UDP-N-acetylmuramate dehydrogenase
MMETIRLMGWQEMEHSKPNKWNALEQWLAEGKHGKWQALAPLSAYTSWKIGGPARIMVWPEDEGQCVRLLRYCLLEDIPVRVLGLGTNLLVADEGVEALVVHTGEMRGLEWGDSLGAEGGGEGEALQAGDGWALHAGAGKASQADMRVASHAGAGDHTAEGKASQADESMVMQAGAGVPLSVIAAAAAREGLTGLEFAAGIPGSFGGALLMNAGAYGGQIADLVEYVRVLDEAGTVRTLGSEELGFGYRASALKASGLLIVRGGLRLTYGERDKIQSTMAKYLELRRENQPLDLPSGGSVFRNPAGGGAGRFIDGAGLKGLRVGNAQISEKHANFIVNLGGARAEDVRALMDIASREVWEKYGVALESEIVCWD